MIIRSWKQSDCPQIVELVAAILKQEFPKAQSAYPMEDLKDLSKNYAGENDAFLVAEEGGRVIGTCGVKADGSKTAILRRLFVLSEYRGKGVGRSLLQESLVFCRKKKFREVIIRTSDTMERAVRLCRAAGFKPDGDWSLGGVTLVRYRLGLS